MFEILGYIMWVHIIAYILDLVIITGVAYIFTHNLGTSILIAIISYLIMQVKNAIINKRFLS